VPAEIDLFGQLMGKEERKCVYEWKKAFGFGGRH
jgi:hypothetical protein